MRPLLISAVLLLSVLFAFTSAETYYVIPNASTPCPKEGVPCFTLSQYANKQNNYFASNTTLILLPGNHSLDSEFEIRNNIAANLAIIQNAITARSESDTSIICSHSARFILSDNGAVSMRGLVLIGCTNNLIALVKQFTLEDCSLQGQERDGTGLKLTSVTSANIMRSSFSSCTGGEIWDPYVEINARAGGAITIMSSTVTISNSTFYNNIVSGEIEVMYGGAVYAVLGNISIHTTTFNDNTVTGVYALGGAVYVDSSTVAIQNATFNNNNVTGETVFGGAVYAGSLSNITLNNTTLNNNTVTGYAAFGGAVTAVSSTIIIQTTTFNNNSITGYNSSSGGAVYAWFSNITTRITSFNNNTGATGGAMFARSSNITIQTTTFNNNTVTGEFDRARGGAVHSRSSNITLQTSTFNNNTATGISAGGAAVFADSSNIIIHNTTFNNNTVAGILSCGGAVYVLFSIITIHITTFNSNTVVTVEENLPGGTANSRTYLGDGTIHTVTFDNDTTTVGAYSDVFGGAMCAESSNITIHTTIFNSNTVKGSRHSGVAGAMFLLRATLNSAKFLDIKNNMADIGGALYAIQSTMHFSGNTTISNNYGSLYAYASFVTFTGHTNIMNNSFSTNTSQEGGAVTAIQCDIVFTGTAYVSYNTAAINGGGISATLSKLYVHGDITIAYNTASISGGGIYAYQSELHLENHNYNSTNIMFINNSAVEKGGGIHLISSITWMTDHSKTYFVGNHAKRGGGACLETNSKLYIEVEWPDPDKWITLEFTENTAVYGGALYITDDTNSATCHAKPLSTKSTFSSECFMQGLVLSQGNTLWEDMFNIRTTYFINNSASKGGDAIYGGLLDRCTVILHKMNERSDLVFIQSSLNAVSYIHYKTNLNIQDFNDSTKVISSDPVRVCFCRDNKRDCINQPEHVNIKKGETFTVSLVAVDQVNNSISNSTILTQLSTKAGLGEGQSIQTTGEGCTELHHTVTSPQAFEQLHLYADGPCKDIGISLQTVNITFAACPIGFKDTGSKCDCDPELTQYISNCSIDTQSVLRRGNVWIAFPNTSVNKSVVTYPNCPFDYCYPSTKQIRIKVDIPDDADKQCAFNRSGKLCGSCKDGLSLSLGSSRCIPCSNKWLALLIVFAIAGVALVAFILVCNLTVAAGTVNGLLFYANIVSSNKAVFFTNSTNRFFAIFIAWLNLDFGFETCFFNGLNGYWKTWLQLAFPAYVIFLVVLIIKACEYSAKFARFMRRVARNNPVATLDTLVLLSYTKFIRTIISIWQFATLEYSDGTRETVWLVDGNIMYFELKHVPLFTAALVIFVLALIYTLLMLLWQWLLLCPNRQPVRWIRNSKLHGIMDAYFITFNKKHRYWTGLLLLARVLLYLVSALNGVETTDPGLILLAVSCVIGSLILWQGLIPGKIYRKWLLNAMDSSFLFNLLILTVATFYVRYVGGNQTAVVSISVSIAFITFILIISYHTYTFVFQSLTEKIKVKLFEKLKGTTSQPQQIQNVEGNNENHDGTVSESVVHVPQIPLDSEGNLILDGFDTDEDANALITCTTTDSDPSITKCRVDSQIEMEDFVSNNRSASSPLSVTAYVQAAEVKGEESDASDYDEFTPLLPVNNRLS